MSVRTGLFLAGGNILGNIGARKRLGEGDHVRKGRCGARVLAGRGAERLHLASLMPG
jgi:hypothetical protein